MSEWQSLVNEDHLFLYFLMALFFALMLLSILIKLGWIPWP